MITLDISSQMETFRALLRGVPLTLLLSAIAVVPGGLVGALITAGRISDSRSLRTLAVAYVFIFRGAPFLLLLYLIYYGLPSIPAIRNGPLWSVFASPMGCAFVALVLNASAYVSEVFRAAYESVPHGEKDAGLVHGMSRRMVFRRVTLPIAMREGLPAYSNEVIECVKGTSLMSTITLLEVTGRAGLQVSATFDALPTYVLAGFIYLCINFTLLGAFHAVDRHLTRGTRLRRPQKDVPAITSAAGHREGAVQ